MRISGHPLRWIAACAAALSLTGPSIPAEPGNRELLVFGAASLTEVLGELATEWRKTSNIPVKLSFAASSVLARQIEAGSTADVFISADQAWMDYLQSRQLVSATSRVNLARNRLVLIAPAESRIELDIKPGFDLAGALAGGRLSTADPDMVPVGRYTRAALSALGVWDQVENRVVRADNVRSAMIFVARGEVPLGIVYATDAGIDKKVRVVATFPDGSHPPITYPAALTVTAAPGAAGFLGFLGSSAAAPTWKKYGFLEPAK